jgi:23S rRNA pseudouridine1911/1915/1917 synthase
MVEKYKQKGLEIGIIYEDSDILVINKPAGITVHPASGEQEITVSEMFADSYQGKCNTDRDMIVHRLDKGTSGVMVMAKNEASRDSLIAQFAARMVTKKYIALVMGKVFPAEGVIDIPLARDSSVRNKISPLETGKESKTLYKVTKLYDGYTLISASPKTGRTHQIRVHFAAIGHPIYGDSRYGTPNAEINRIFLHAEEISFTHPTTGKKLKFTCDLPEELKCVLTKLPIE